MNDRARRPFVEALDRGKLEKGELLLFPTLSQFSGVSGRENAHKGFVAKDAGLLIKFF